MKFRVERQVPRISSQLFDQPAVRATGAAWHVRFPVAARSARRRAKLRGECTRRSLSRVQNRWIPVLHGWCLPTVRTFPRRVPHARSLACSLARISVVVATPRQWFASKRSHQCATPLFFPSRAASFFWIASRSRRKSAAFSPTERLH